jgi:ankyrin repeat protein
MFREPALLRGCLNGDIDTVDVLLRHGAVVNATAELAFDPMTAAIAKQRLAIIAKLVAASECSQSLCSYVLPFSEEFSTRVCHIAGSDFCLKRPLYDV